MFIKYQNLNKGFYNIALVFTKTKVDKKQLFLLP